MERAYVAVYRQLFEEHWWWRARTEILIGTLHGLGPAAGWSSILDVGCGDGLLFDRLSELGEVEGVESDPTTLSETSRHRDRIHIGPFDDSFQPRRSYSLILMLDLLEHLEDPAAAVRRALELLEPEGTILITVPAFDALWTSHDELNRHLRRYTKRSFRRLAADSELRIDRLRYFFHWVFKAKLVQRGIERLLGSQPAPPRIPPPPINGLLFRWSLLEHRLLRGLDLPFGSSLMAIGGHGVPPARCGATPQTSPSRRHPQGRPSCGRSPRQASSTMRFDIACVGLP